jgi:hypothetical protein
MIWAGRYTKLAASKKPGLCWNALFRWTKMTNWRPKTFVSAWAAVSTIIAVELLDEVHGALSPVRTHSVGAGSCVVDVWKTGRRLKRIILYLT